jgi:regulator of PEP synthase PpsR (kinase-PPPase family)
VADHREGTADEAGGPGGSLKNFHLHLVSDATGETINSVARACVSQFDKARPVEHFWNLVRTDRQLDLVLEGIRDNPGMVMFTLVNDRLRRKLQEVCRDLAVPCIPVLDPLIAALGAFLGLESQSQPGRQHALDAEYFGRIDAMDFALNHDDGQSAWSLHEADVILVGVSRTSKTPTCIYMANRGVKAANVPWVPGVALPPELDQLKRPLIVGLTKDAERLVQIRRNRLRLLNQGEETGYTDPEQVRAELTEARRYYGRRGWPVIDVTRRSIEETAAEVLMLLARRRPAGMGSPLASPLPAPDPLAGTRLPDEGE